MTHNEPRWSSLESAPVPGWFEDAPFGIYFHWGPYAVPAYGGEWYPRHMYQADSDTHEHHATTYGDPSDVGYREFIPEFHGEDFDAEEWVDLCADAGAKFVGITAVHHDGFALWDSELTAYNAADMGPKRDVVGELAAATHDRGMKFVAAFHHAWTWWYYPRREGLDTMDPAYADLYGPPHDEGEEPPESYFETWRDKILEVVDGYRPDLLWFDFGWGNGSFAAHDEYRREVVAHYYNRAEEWDKEVGVAHKRDLPVGVGILDYERTRREDLATQRWLTDTSVDRESWGYVSDPDYKDPTTLVTGFIDRLSKNGNTLLNVGPRADGTIPEAAADRVRAVGEWLEANGEAVYGTRPWRVSGEGPTNVTSTEFEEASTITFTADDVRFTRDEETAYAVLMDWPSDGTVTIETSLHHRLTASERADDPVEPESVTLLGADIDLDYETAEDTLRVFLPEKAPEGLDHAYALRLRPP